MPREDFSGILDTMGSLQHGFGKIANRSHNRYEEHEAQNRQIKWVYGDNMQEPKRSQDTAKSTPYCPFPGLPRTDRGMELMPPHGTSHIKSACVTQEYNGQQEEYPDISAGMPVHKNEQGKGKGDIQEAESHFAHLIYSLGPSGRRKKEIKPQGNHHPKGEDRQRDEKRALGDRKKKEEGKEEATEFDGPWQLGRSHIKKLGERDRRGKEEETVKKPSGCRPNDIYQDRQGYNSGQPSLYMHHSENPDPIPRVVMVTKSLPRYLR